MHTRKKCVHEKSEIPEQCGVVARRLQLFSRPQYVPRPHNGFPMHAKRATSRIDTGRIIVFLIVPRSVSLPSCNQ